jgi:hypothetical protein
MKRINATNKILLLPFCNIRIGVDFYQERLRYYLDEYPEQEKLRKEYKLHLKEDK